MNSNWNGGITSDFAKGILLLFALALSGCSSLLFYPQKNLVLNPSDIPIDYQDIDLESADHTALHGWLLKASEPKGVVLFLHGNAENISTHIASVYWLPAYGYDVVLLDYRGYGRSKGSPKLPDVFMDIDAAYRWTLNYSKQKQLAVTVLAQSLGAAIASYYFSQLPPDDQPQGIVLDAVFNSYGDIAKNAMSNSIMTWPFQFVAPWVMPDGFDPVDHIGAISAPLLFFHSDDDRIVPAQLNRPVFVAAKSPKCYIKTSGSHIATFFSERNRKILLHFLASPDEVENVCR